MDYPVSDALKDLLSRKGMRGNGPARPALHKGMGAGYVEGAFTYPATVQQGEDSRAPMGMGKGPDAGAPGQVRLGVGNSTKDARDEADLAAKEPSPAKGRPVLTLVHCSARPRDRKHRPLRLELVVSNT